MRRNSLTVGTTWLVGLSCLCMLGIAVSAMADQGETRKVSVAVLDSHGNLVPEALLGHRDSRPEGIRGVPAGDGTWLIEPLATDLKIELLVKEDTFGFASAEVLLPADAAVSLEVYLEGKAARVEVVPGNQPLTATSSVPSRAGGPWPPVQSTSVLNWTFAESTGTRDSACPVGSLFDQPPTPPDGGWTAGVSDLRSGSGYSSLIRYEDFWDAGEICDIHFWGLTLSYPWADCTEDPMDFEVTFYNDDSGAPGTVACGPYTLSISGVASGDYWSGFPLYEFGADLDPCCTLAEGWVSVQATSVDSPDCWFLWGSHDETGSGMSLLYDSDLGWTTEDFDLSLCLTGVPATGACCDDDTAVCDDDVTMGNCTGRWAADTLCIDLDPACGDWVPTGACCNPDEPYDCFPDKSEADCDVISFIWMGEGTDCSPNPCLPGCDHTIVLTDDYGDGWNGGLVEVFVDGGSVGAYTIATGAGPDTYTFNAATGSAISTVYTAGGWPYENEYHVYDVNGFEICAEGVGGVEPVGGDCGLGNCGGDPCDGNWPANDYCVDAIPVSGPYPTTVDGTNYCARIDCPGVLDWYATWWEIDLPYTVNDLRVSYCPSGFEINHAGIVVYDDCTDCNAYILDDLTDWYSCPGGQTAPQMYWYELPGPATVFFPVMFNYNSGVAYSLEIDVATPPTGACCLAGDCLATNWEVECDALGGMWYEGEDCATYQCPVPPPNDDCVNAEALGTLPATATFDNTLATDDIAVPCGVSTGPYKNVWYTVTGTGNTMTATTCNAGTFVSDTKISVFCLECADLQCIDGNDDSCSGHGSLLSTVSWCSQVGAIYYITVGNYSSTTVPGVIQVDVTDGDSCTPTGDELCLPEGACCLSDNSCVITTQIDCEDYLFGDYQGDDTDCGLVWVAEEGRGGTLLPSTLALDWTFAESTGTRAMTCPPGSLFDQPPTPASGGWTAGVSDLRTGSGYSSLIRYEDFWDAGVICDIHFWGLTLSYPWADCVEDPMTFEVTFYNDDSGAPGTVACGPYTLSISGVASGDYWSGFPLYEFGADLDPCCTLAEGWVSVQATSVDSPDCWFLWGSHDETGSGMSLLYDSDLGWTTEDFDLSLCLTGVPATGACCDDDTAVCDDDVTMGNCTGRWAADTLCIDLDPACGDWVPTGACCNPDEPYDCFPDKSEADCDVISFIWMGEGTDCSPNPCLPGCDHTIVLTDDYGDGWNGGLVEVFVGGDSVGVYTIGSGAGPETYTFNAATGSSITTVYTPGSWPYENEYHIYDVDGGEICAEGEGGVEPDGGDCGLGNCGDLPGACCVDLVCVETNTASECDAMGGSWYIGEDCDAGFECPTTCEHTIAMWDSYGDGWNGCYIDVYLNGDLLLAGVTLPSGSGPGYAYFAADPCDEISIDFTSASYPTETSYCVYGGLGDELGCADGGYDPGDGDLIVYGKCNGQPGACCFADGSCEDGMTPAACEEAGGVYNLCKECATFDCPQYQGACCMPDGTCVVTTEACCDEAGAVFVGGGTDCGGAGGAEPINLLTWMEDHSAYGPGEAVAIDISAYAGLTVQVVFRYYGDSWDWYAEVDDVTVPGVFFEDFNSGMPGDWTLLDRAGNGFYWTLNSLTGRTNYAGGDGDCAIADQDDYWDYPYDTSLITPWFVVPDGGTLEFIAAYNYLGSGEAFEVNIIVQQPPTTSPCQYMDVKPGSCPNPFNLKSHGVLPVALMGTAELDVTMVDISSIVLCRADGVAGCAAPNEGPPGPHSTFEDVATPFYGDMCDCDSLGGDGFVDLMMKFKSDDVASALNLDGMPGGSVVPLVLRGNLPDGRPFVAGTDCIWFVPPNVPPGVVSVISNVPGTWVDVYPQDNTLDFGGFADFDRGYFVGQTMTVTADEMSEGRPFRAWVVDGVWQAYGETVLEITVPVHTTARAVYRAAVGPTPDRPGLSGDQQQDPNTDGPLQGGL